MQGSETEAAIDDSATIIAYARDIAHQENGAVGDKTTKTTAYNPSPAAPSSYDGTALRTRDLFLSKIISAERSSHIGSVIDASSSVEGAAFAKEEDVDSSTTTLEATPTKTASPVTKHSPATRPDSVFKLIPATAPRAGLSHGTSSGTRAGSSPSPPLLEGVVQSHSPIAGSLAGRLASTVCKVKGNPDPRMSPALGSLALSQKALKILPKPSVRIFY